MYAPKFDNYLFGLDLGCRGLSNNVTYNAEAYPIIDVIMSLLKKITPCSSNGCRELWFCLERGPIEEYKNFEEELEDGNVTTYEEFVEKWKEEYPDEEKWYHFYGVEIDNDYQSISINNCHVIQVSPNGGKSAFPYDISDFISFLKDKVEFCLNQIREGVYMDFVRPRIPDTYKTGTILQGDLWELDPEEKEAYFEGLSESDIAEFLDYMSKQDHSDYRPQGRIQNMTANEFYRFCALGYQAMNYNGCDQPLRKQYVMHADGRDEGLGEINPDSPQAFHEWLVDGHRGGGHPWEVCRGGNSTHISLYVGIDHDGYYLSLEGSSYGRSPETIKFYLALRRNEIPVFLYGGDHLADRVQGKEKVGVVPQGVIPKYCHGDFPGEDMIVFMNLPYEDTEAYAAKCVWQDIKEVRLLQKEENG